MRAQTAAFPAAMERHCRFEKALPFPPRVAVSPLSAGPTAMKRQRHAQIRTLLDDLGAAIGASPFRRATC